MNQKAQFDVIDVTQYLILNQEYWVVQSVDITHVVVVHAYVFMRVTIMNTGTLYNCHLYRFSREDRFE